MNRIAPSCWHLTNACLVVGLALAVPRPLLAQQKDLRISVGEAGLYKKVIIRGKAALFEKPGGQSSPLSSFLVFHKLKTDDGQEEKDGFVRVGKISGAPLGWVKKEHVIDWNTRLAFDPLLPAPPNSVFRIFPNEDLTGDGFEYTGINAGYKTMAAILKKPAKEDDPVYNVAFFAGVEQGATSRVAAADVNLKELQLEIVFVIDTTASMTPLLEGMKEILREVAKTVASRPGLKGAVRLGLVEYQDETAGLKKANMVSKLTDDLDAFLKTIEPLKVANLGSEETKEDVLAGLKMAIEDSGWNKVSVKQIILLGDASAHIAFCHRDGSVCKYCDAKTGVCKKNTTGLDIKKVIDLGRRVTGTPELPGESGKQLGSIDFHAVQALQQIDPETDAPIAERQFKEIAANNGEVKGYFTKLDPKKKDQKEKTIAELVKVLEDAFKPVALARAGKAKQVSPKELVGVTAIAQAVYRRINATQGKPLQDVELGWAKEKSAKQKRVATQRVLISQKELIRLRSTLDNLHVVFSSRIEPDERGDVKEILEILEQAVIGVQTGQFIKKDIVKEGTKLKKLIEQLPLKSNVLDISAEDLKKFNAQDFRSWLTRLEDTVKRAKALEKSAQWMDLSGGNIKDEKYTFLLLAELP